MTISTQSPASSVNERSCSKKTRTSASEPPSSPMTLKRLIGCWTRSATTALWKGAQAEPPASSCSTGMSFASFYTASLPRLASLYRRANWRSFFARLRERARKIAGCFLTWRGARPSRSVTCGILGLCDLSPGGVPTSGNYIPKNRRLWKTRLVFEFQKPHVRRALLPIRLISIALWQACKLAGKRFLFGRLIRAMPSRHAIPLPGEIGAALHVL